MKEYGVSDFFEELYNHVALKTAAHVLNFDGVIAFYWKFNQGFSP